MKNVPKSLRLLGLWGGEGPTRGEISFQLAFVYALPLLSMFWMTGGIGVLQGVYAKYYGLNLITLGGILLFVRVFDAVTDPLVGFFSDRSMRRTGSRKLLIIVGGVLLSVGGGLLYIPLVPTELYVLVFVTVFYLGFTLFYIPYLAWGSDIATTALGKSKIFTANGLAGKAGYGVFFFTPLLPVFTTSEITPATLQVTGIGAGTSLIVFMVVAMKVVPDGPALSPGEKDAPLKLRRMFSDYVRSIITNRPMASLLAMYWLFNLGVGMWGAMHFLYIDVYLGFGSVFAELYLFAMIAGAVSTPLWGWLSIRFGKRLALATGHILFAAGCAYGAILTPETGSYIQLLFLKSLCAIGTASTIVVAPAMMSETIDLAQLKYRIERAGSYFSVFVFVLKFAQALGLGIALATVGALGFDATTSEQSSSGAFGLKMMIGWFPLVLALAAALLAVSNPMTKSRHAIIRARLDQRKHRQTRWK